MNVYELLQKTVDMGILDAHFHDRSENRRSTDYVLRKKPFGHIYWDNLVMAYKGDVIELTLVMGSVTDLHKSNHRIAIALKGIDYEEVTETELVKIIKSKNAGLEDTSKEELISNILNSNLQLIEGKTIVQKSTTERKFFILPNKIDLSTEIAVRCSCSDFHWTYSWYNADHGCLIGKRPPAYQRKHTDEKGRFRTLRNIHKIPGMCKHLILFMALLMRGGLIETLPLLTSNLTTNIQKKKLKRVSSNKIDVLLKGLKQELLAEKQIRKGFNN